MSKAQDLIKSLEETVNPQYRTKVKMVKENLGSKHIRHVTEKAKMFTEQMMNPNHPSPNPKDQASMMRLEKCKSKLGERIGLLKEVKDTKRKP